MLPSLSLGFEQLVYFFKGKAEAGGDELDLFAWLNSCVFQDLITRNERQGLQFGLDQITFIVEIILVIVSVLPEDHLELLGQNLERQRLRHALQGAAYFEGFTQRCLQRLMLSDPFS